MRKSELEFGLKSGPIRIVGADENSFERRNNGGVELCLNTLS